jgi:hypothetical protein
MKNCDLKKEFSYLIPVDANNLCGNAMCYKLRNGNFKWCSQKVIDIMCHQIKKLQMIGILVSLYESILSTNNDYIIIIMIFHPE